MNARAHPTVVAIMVSSALLTSCGRTPAPTAPSQLTPQPPSTGPNQPFPNPVRTSPVQVDLMALSDPTQDAHAIWVYELTVRLRETGGTSITVVNIQIDAIADSRFLGAASVSPMLAMTAGAQNDLALMFLSEKFAHNGEVTVNILIRYTDANGNSGQVNDSGSCFGCWDY
jgi:hypothetical protein